MRNAYFLASRLLKGEIYVCKRNWDVPVFYFPLLMQHLLNTFAYNVASAERTRESYSLHFDRDDYSDSSAQL